MALAPGAHLGSYEVTALIGQGGMGEVYQARDTKLNRNVALKVLADFFTNDPERLVRFQREAQGSGPPPGSPAFRNSTLAVRRHLCEMRDGRKTY